MKKNSLFSLLFLALLGLVGCENGAGNSQNMPIGGTPFTGTFTPGIATLQGSTTTCSANSPAEALTFVVQESTTFFYDLNIASGSQPIITGSFTNGGQAVNQNNPCFTGNVNYAPYCSAAQMGTITFNGCSVNLLGSGYVFKATYYLKSSQGVIVSTGSIYATK